MFFRPCISAQSLRITNLMSSSFSCTFISILYMFRAAMCPSSGKLILSVRYLVCVTLYRWPFGVQVWMRLVGPGWGGSIIPPQYTPTSPRTNQHIPNSVYSYFSGLPPQYKPTPVYCHLSIFPPQHTPTSVYSHLSALPPQYTPTLVYSHLSIFPPQYTPTSV
jgi:hypothetical protein